MATFKYTGEAPNGPFHMYGATWDTGGTAEVSDPVFAAKLRGNRFFEEVSTEAAPIQKTRKAHKAKVVTDDDTDAAPTE